MIEAIASIRFGSWQQPGGLPLEISCDAVQGFPILAADLLPFAHRAPFFFSFSPLAFLLDP